MVRYPLQHRLDLLHCRFHKSSKYFKYHLQVLGGFKTLSLQCVNASILSLPLPLMVFLWGTLSLPRPTKTFWVTLIGYTQSLVLLKCIFQFKGIWKPFIKEGNSPLSVAPLIGLDVDSKYTTYDLILLLVLFFHRFILKSQGLWKSEYNENLQEGAYVASSELPDTETVGSQQSL